jgi:hypothetical protein
MKKLKLDLDQVQVVSFTVETVGRSGGTVNGFGPDTDIGCGGGSGDSCESCFPHRCDDMPDSAHSPC